MFVVSAELFQFLAERHADGSIGSTVIGDIEDAIWHAAVMNYAMLPQMLDTLA